MTTIQSPPPPASSNRRPNCPSCAKPSRFCLCVRIQNPNLRNSTAVTILEHTLEKKHPLNSAKIATLGLQNVVVASVSDVNIHATFSIRVMMETQNPPKKSSDFDESSFTLTSNVIFNEQILYNDCVGKTSDGDSKLEETGRIWEIQILTVPAGSMLLFPSERAVGIQERRKIDGHKEVKNLIVLDGTWAKAKRMYKENPWLDLLPHLKLEMEMMSLYSEVRSQPRDGCLSTIESIVYALKGLGEETDHGLDELLQGFGSMVEDQRRCKDQRRSMTAKAFSSSYPLSRDQSSHGVTTKHDNMNFGNMTEYDQRDKSHGRSSIFVKKYESAPTTREIEMSSEIQELSGLRTDIITVDSGHINQ
ncbi:uncharacterized protein LOC124934763 [Impatiens glandulifera]|uniref:uncharacterized protein LOC124934763 n=1 Tax=Impatiens glandulifera TaxID=253017 RepID=UPI001FB18190|nr:uncharacterized protein LOC124934763 [Impatiens glandulifera]